MKKLLSGIVLAIAIILCLLPCCISAETAGEVVYEESFEHGETDIFPTSEKTGSAVIKTENGNSYLHFDGNESADYSLACFGPYVADFDYSVKIRQKIHNGSWSYCMILFHIDWNVNAYRVDMFEDHARLAFNNGVDDEQIFGSYDGFGVQDDKWHDVRVFGRGNEYTVVMDGRVIDTFVSDERDEGNFGFCGWQTEFDVDDIKITEYVDGTAPAVSTLVEGVEEEKIDKEIIKTQRKTRKMKDTAIKVIGGLSESSALTQVLFYVAAGVAAVCVAVIAVILIILLTKRGRKKRK